MGDPNRRPGVTFIAAKTPPFIAAIHRCRLCHCRGYFRCRIPHCRSERQGRRFSVRPVLGILRFQEPRVACLYFYRGAACGVTSKPGAGIRCVVFPGLRFRSRTRATAMPNIQMSFASAVSHRPAASPTSQVNTASYMTECALRDPPAYSTHGYLWPCNCSSPTHFPLTALVIVMLRNGSCSEACKAFVSRCPWG